MVDQKARSQDLLRLVRNVERAWQVLEAKRGAFDDQVKHIAKEIEGLLRDLGAPAEPSLLHHWAFEFFDDLDNYRVDVPIIMRWQKLNLKLVELCLLLGIDFDEHPNLVPDYNLIRRPSARPIIPQSQSELQERAFDHLAADLYVEAARNIFHTPCAVFFQGFPDSTLPVVEISVPASISYPHREFADKERELHGIVEQEDPQSVGRVIIRYARIRNEA